MKKLCLNEFLLSLLVSDLEKRPLVVHFQTIEYSLHSQTMEHGKKQDKALQGGP